MDWNYAGALIGRFFSVVNTSVLRGLWLVESVDAEEPPIWRTDSYVVFGLTPTCSEAKCIYLLDVAEILEFMSLFISLNLGNSWTLFSHLYPVRSAQ